MPHHFGPRLNLNDKNLENLIKLIKSLKNTLPISLNLIPSILLFQVSSLTWFLLLRTRHLFYLIPNAILKSLISH